MKKPHLIILVLASVMALFSVYSLAAISQVHNINFDWYSAYNEKFVNKPRELSGDKWSLDALPKDLLFEIISKRDDFLLLQRKGIKIEPSIAKTDMDKYILLYCSLGEVNSPEYRIKVEDIAQRGSAVEIKVSINSPEEIDSYTQNSWNAYFPVDIVRIDKSSFPTRGELYFIFKSKNGKQLAEVKRAIE